MKLENSNLTFQMRKDLADSQMFTNQQAIESDNENGPVNRNSMFQQRAEVTRALLSNDQQNIASDLIRKRRSQKRQYLIGGAKLGSFHTTNDFNKHSFKSITTDNGDGHPKTQRSDKSNERSLKREREQFRNSDKKGFEN